MRILPSWLREFVDVPADNRQLAEALTSAGIAVESIQQEHGETVYEMDLTTNRVDAMNHYGVAREASAIYDVELKPVRRGVDSVLSTAAAKSTPPPLAMTNSERGAPLGMTPDQERAALRRTQSGEQALAVATASTGRFPIVIEDPHGCARYTARIVRGVSIGPSPELVVKRLELLGSRSINNAADATNYALNELGHPTHAFDLDLLDGGTIIVRRARDGETLKTLDGVDRKLTTEDLIIADANKPVALAGVMGGFDTMITERTRNVLIESAWFEPWTVRAMAKRHLMHTDASHRFERGADYGITPLACDRVAELILKSAGGELSGDRIDAVARKLERASITLRSSEIKRNLGIDIPSNEVERILDNLGFKIRPADPKGFAGTLDDTPHPPTAGAALAQHDNNGRCATWEIQLPSWRLDVEREIDLLEEIARIYGYNRFPNTLPPFVGAVVELPDEAKNARVRQTMLALGYNEAIAITFISEQDARTFGHFENTHSSKKRLSGAPDRARTEWGRPTTEPLMLANPLSEEARCMRTSLLPGLLTLAGYNLNRGTTDLRLFEAGEVFEKTGDSHDERRHLGFLATGDVQPATVHTAAQPYTFFHMKGELEELLGSFEHKSLEFDANTPPYLHPGRSAVALMDGEVVALFGQLHPEQAAARKLRQDVYLAEVMLERLYRHALREPRYRRISKFPAVQRDFSFVFDDAVTWEKIKSEVDGLRIAELIELQPAEIYRGEKAGPGKYSLLIRAGFQSQQRTLRDDEVAQWSAQIISRLEALGGVLRA
jgi:phenylalanyl-tRNA synthetase beta chain